MGLIVHNVSTPDSGLGDALRTGFVNQNTMNAELYNTVVFKVSGYDLSKNDFTDVLLAKLNSIDATAQPNVKSDWSNSDPNSDAYILNKPIFASSQILVGAEWTGTGLEFDVYADLFPILDGSYSATPATVTLDAADGALDRIDLIVAIAPISPAIIGTVGKITGTAAASPEAPDYDPSLYYVIKEVRVNAAATTPADTSNTQIYDDSLTADWAVTLSANVSQTANDPSVGTNSLEAVNWITTDYMKFAAPSPISTADIGVLKFDFKLKEDGGTAYFRIKFFNSGILIDSRFFNSGDNYYVSSSLSYQTIKINSSALGLNIYNFDTIQVEFLTSISGFYFDNFQLLKGSGSEVPPGTGIPDVENDSILYGRKNGAWEGIPNISEPTVAKTTPLDADTFTLWDSAVGFIAKKLSWANIKTALDLIYMKLAGGAFTGDVTFNDNIKALFGTGGAESEIFSNSTNTNFNLKSGNLAVQNNGVDIFLVNRSTGKVTFYDVIESENLIVNTSLSDYGMRVLHASGSGFSPASILLEASSAGVRGQGIYHTNTINNKTWFSGTLYNGSSNAWALAYKAGTGEDTAQTTYEVLSVDTNGNLIIKGKLVEESVIGTADYVSIATTGVTCDLTEFSSRYYNVTAASTITLDTSGIATGESVAKTLTVDGAFSFSITNTAKTIGSYAANGNEHRVTIEVTKYPTAGEKIVVTYQDLGS